MDAFNCNDKDMKYLEAMSDMFLYINNIRTTCLGDVKACCTDEAKFCAQQCMPCYAAFMAPPVEETAETCVDDGNRTIADLGAQCGQFMIIGCDADISSVVPTVEPGTLLKGVCPLSCGQCTPAEQAQCEPTVPAADDPIDTVTRTDGGDCADCKYCQGFLQCLPFMRDPTYCRAEFYEAPPELPAADCSAEAAFRALRPQPKSPDLELGTIYLLLTTSPYRR